MPTFNTGDPIRVRRGHDGCTWCEAVQGRVGAIVGRSENSADGPFYDVRLAVIDTPGDEGALLPLKADCLEPER